MNGKLKYMEAMFGEQVQKDLFDEVVITRDIRKRGKRAFNLAHKIRMFEIDLYWKRALYFWGFQAAIFLVFGVLFGKDIPFRYEPLRNFLIPLISLTGFVTAIAWYYVNRGSKAWQENWERHIDLLEDDFSGNLYKTIIKGEEEFYSVSKINNFISGFMASIWIAIPIFLLFERWISCFWWVFFCFYDVFLALVLFAALVIFICIRNRKKSAPAKKEDVTVCKRYVNITAVKCVCGLEQTGECLCQSPRNK